MTDKNRQRPPQQQGPRATALGHHRRRHHNEWCCRHVDTRVRRVAHKISSLHSMDADFTRRLWGLKRSMRDRDEEWQRREGGTSPARLPWGPWKARISRFQERIHYMDADFTRHVWGLKRSIRGS